MAFWKEDKKDTPATLDRIAASLERLVILYELELISKGLVTRTDDGEGEVYEFDPEASALRDLEEELKKKYGLPTGVKLGAGGRDGAGWRPEDTPDGSLPEPLPIWSPSGLAFPTGPEGAEAAEQGSEEQWSGRDGTPGIPT